MAVTKNRSQIGHSIWPSNQISECVQPMPRPLSLLKRTSVALSLPPAIPPPPSRNTQPGSDTKIVVPRRRRKNMRDKAAVMVKVICFMERLLHSTRLEEELRNSEPTPHRPARLYPQT